MFKNKIEEIAKKILDLPDFYLVATENLTFGDYTGNIALIKSKELKVDPRELANSYKEKLEKDRDLSEIVEKIEVAGPGFINFWLKVDVLVDTLRHIDIAEEKYGQSEEGNGKTVVVDYSAPNIAKPFGIGHLKSTIIGQALYNLYRALGYKVIGDNHLGDWGTQFGKLLFMIDSTETADYSIDNLEKMYVEFHKHPEWEGEGRKWFKLLESGDKGARLMWEKCVEVSMVEFERVYLLMKITIDNALGESFYEPMIPAVLEDSKNKGLSIESDGAQIIEVEGSEVPLMLLKSDGATTYATRDLATLKYRGEKWNPDIVIYEVGVEQKLHFQQVFFVAKKLGYVKPETVLYHTAHGWYLGEDGKKFSTRKGKTVKLSDVFDEAIARSEKMGNTGQTAIDVGIGAIKYFDLSHNVQSDIIFDWEKIMSLDGNSGPYIQYVFARTQSVARNAAESGGNEDETGSFKPEELDLLRTMVHYPEIIKDAAVNFSPNLLCNYLFDLAQKYNTFYNKLRIIEDGKVINTRLTINNATGQVIKNGLTLLGIEAPEKM